MAHEQPNFDLDLDLSMNTSEDENESHQISLDRPNFDLGIDDWLEFSDEEEEDMHVHSIPNFDLGIENWFDLSSDDEMEISTDDDSEHENRLCMQEGFGDSLYTLENTRHRHITKFNVTGSEYRLSVPAIDRQYTYNEAAQLLHRILRGNRKCISMNIFYFVYFTPHDPS